MSGVNATTVPWRVYLYGAGSIAWRHGVAAESLGPDAQLFAADPSEDARQALLAKFPNATVYEDAEVMLASSPGQERDIVVVAVPPYLHHAATLLAFRSNRHVLCEKPLATSATEMAEMLAASDASGRYFGECSFRYLGNGALDRARQLIETGGIGSVYHARFINRQPRSRAGIEYQPASRWFLEKKKSGGGIIFDWGVYDFTMFFDVLRPVAVTVNHAWMATPKTGANPSDPAISVETHAGASLTLTLQDGAVVPFDWERASGFHGDAQVALNVDGTAGGLTWEWVPTFDYKDEVDELEEGFGLVHSVDVNGKVQNKEEKFPAFGWEDANQRPLLSFVDLVEGRNSVALSRSRLEFNFAVVSAIYKCASEGTPVHVQLK
ncbi:oxidoreductase family protein [Colletotrichum graminicola]|uniref:Oxidoreductase family protein n=1 Tax=Colletotrichum graminicola (strain M1.001 / M2 / FGSC 10212) TaxID=645133 RepID=E3QIF8_COLGM|nr:oxidoreductase family protein [Colletotrichum graminicola M1.001]EFQ30568.1 oxidoreductase family protein [Colletotrichum graminicola M1.001]WDK21275.1 oxidoreductase family protein [Colletotrichum graminicola]